jgi:hypothetical protein
MKNASVPGIAREPIPLVSLARDIQRLCGMGNAASMVYVMVRAKIFCSSEYFAFGRTYLFFKSPRSWNSSCQAFNEFLSRNPIGESSLYSVCQA